MSAQVTLGQCARYSTFSRPAAQASLPQGQQTYLPLGMFAYLTLDQIHV